jgi:hypothetical protein
MNGRGGRGQCFSVKEMEDGRGISIEWTYKMMEKQHGREEGRK